MKSPNEIVQEMLKNDYFSRLLEIELVNIEKGNCVLKLRVKKQDLNGFGIAHGGITYSLADSALAFASNAHGFKAFSIETSISHLKKVSENTILTAQCIEIHKGNRIGKYEVKITDDSQILVAHFLGTVFYSEEKW